MTETLDLRRRISIERLGARGEGLARTPSGTIAVPYALPGEEPVYRYSWGRQNWFEASRQEHMAVRETVGLFDQSSFAKFVVKGRDAMKVLNRLGDAEVDVDPGRVVYTQWLNGKGGIEADLTVTRPSLEDAFLALTDDAGGGDGGEP